ncbi:MAG: HNH endonuclease [Desulfobacterales bacterium]|jgi:5-methylcytosine-specific restriction endonuclease McrA|nr:HNH endonuclease [Desulfobacterales bacterium]
MRHCILLNADYTFLNLVNWKRAVCLLTKGKVEVIKDSDSAVRVASGVEMRIPAVMRLVKLIRTIYRAGVAFTKRNVLVRDGLRCAYCGGQKERLSIDHIVPKSRGGKTNFENCVAACRSCNLKKGGRTPNEAAMYLKVKAFQPTISEFLRMKFQNSGFSDLLAELSV